MSSLRRCREMITRLLPLLLLPVLSALPTPHHLRSTPRRTIERAADEQQMLDIANIVLRDDKITTPPSVSAADGFPAPASTLPPITDIDVIDEIGPVSTVHVCDEDNAPNRSVIYCSGKLLEAVMAVKLHPDSKTFVDRPLKRGLNGPDVAAKFAEQFPQPADSISFDEVKKFVNDHFDEEGHELEECTLADWSPSPLGFASIVDPSLRKFAMDLHSIWKQLCRKMKPEVREDPGRFSLLYVPHPFIIPGGRFREFYYWDAYWIVKGLLASSLFTTTRGMLLNLAHMVEQHGFVPNGGRVYYLRRSQPPFLTAMVYEYYEATKDRELLRQLLPTLEKEHDFWINNRTVSLTTASEETFVMLQYRTAANVPRPESFREDTLSSAAFNTTADKQRFYQNLGSAAESGWDFSSRWFADGQNLTTIESINIVPVDLNAMHCYNLNMMSYLHSQLGNSNKESAWQTEYLRFRDAFQKVFWVQDESNTGWFDFNTRTGKHNTAYFASNAVPLFAGCFDSLSLSTSDNVFNHMADDGVFSYPGGVPMSLVDSHQQWDFPNGWAPNVHMIIEGLRKSQNPRMQQKAFELAEKWVLSNWRSFQTDKAMWEKYNVADDHTGGAGGGGEYAVQAGFGWSNGAVLDLLRSYGHRLTIPTRDLVKYSKNQPTQSASSHLPLILVALIAVWRLF